MLTVENDELVIVDSKNSEALDPKSRIPLRERSGVASDDLMGIAGRKVLTFHFARMLAQDGPVREGKDIEAVHDMRVATRRLRSAFDLFRPFLHDKQVKPFLKVLKKTADALGEVRDLEVFLEKAAQYAETAPDGHRDEIRLFVDSWQPQLDAARQKLIETLDGHRYAEFVTQFTDFLTDTSQPDGRTGRKSAHGEYPIPSLVRHIAPTLIYEHYAAVRAYDVSLPNVSLDTLHMLRIEGKRLRYTLEAFEEVLGSQAKSVIQAIKALQDHLGELQDARVAGVMMSEWILTAQERQPTGAILHYMGIREEEKQKLLSTFSSAWEEYSKPEVRRSLALSISAL